MTSKYDTERYAVVWYSDRYHVIDKMDDNHSVSVHISRGAAHLKATKLNKEERSR